MRRALKFLVSTAFATWITCSIGAAETGMRPKAITGPSETPFILTPKARAQAADQGPDGLRLPTGNPFLYRIPATGQRPMLFAAENLPEGLTLDAHTGIITGSVARRGEYLVTLRAGNAQGKAERDFKIVCGDRLALTPPMGWNHWYTHYDRVTDKIMREAADIMVSSGMADVGYQYVNIDDCWTNVPMGTPKARSNPDPLRVGPRATRRATSCPTSTSPT